MEVVVVLLVIGIISTLAWAGYQYASRSVEQAPVRGNLDTVATVQEREWRTTGAYRSEVSWLDSLSMGVSFTNESSSDDGTVSVWVSEPGPEGDLGLAVFSPRLGLCFTHFQTPPGEGFEVVRDEFESSAAGCTGEAASLR